MESPSSSSGSLKRARAPVIGAQTVSCLVDGCNSDLSKCRDYHRRHKVCELHSKTPIVMVGGQEQRFCQQCSRFHSLMEFDEGKRSCRKRLDGHNRRRRKPQPEPLSINSGGLLSSHQGTTYLTFGGPQLYPASAVVSSAWGSLVKVENDAMLYDCNSQINFLDRQSSFTESLSPTYRGKQFPFLQPVETTLPKVSSVSQPLLGPNSTSGNGSGGSPEMCSDGLNRMVVSDGALSLLSSPLADSREIGLSCTVRTNQLPSAQSSIPNLEYNVLALCPGSQERSMLISDGSSNANLNCQGMFQIGTDGSSSTGPHQTLSFSWG